jgi:predicted ATPase
MWHLHFDCLCNNTRQSFCLKKQQQQRQRCTTNIKASTEEQKAEENGTRVLEANWKFWHTVSKIITQPTRTPNIFHYGGVHCYFSRGLHIATAGQELREQHNNPSAISFL